MIDPTVLEQVLRRAASRGADFADVFIEDRATTTLRFLSKKVEEATTGRDYGAGVRACYGDRSVYAYTNDVSPQGLLEAAEAVSRAYSAPQKTLNFTLAGQPRGGSGASGDVAQRLEVLRRADAAARAYDPAVTQVDITLVDSLQRVLIANSEGLLMSDVRPRTRCRIMAIAEGNGEKYAGFSGPGASDDLGYWQVVNLEEQARSAARTAVTMLRAGYAPAGKLPVVIGSDFGGVIFHEACGHLLETTSVAKGASVLAGKLGERIASEVVTALDDGTIGGSWGYLAVDDEGRPGQRTVLIENGILQSYMVDRLGGQKTGYVPTGSARRQSYRYPPTSRMRNTYIAPGTATPEELISKVSFGLYAKKLGGGSVLPGTGDFNFKVEEAYLIKGGQLAEPVRGASLIGNGPEVLQKIVAVGNDLQLTPGMCGSLSGMVPVTVGQPSLLVSEITVGGRQ
ncbi:MAG: TldD/PmbA family protein [Deinococcus sp.]|nr:TldD/PmbA family protein [Deinococcus sp.]